jgi:hypothetical protein
MTPMVMRNTANSVAQQRRDINRIVNEFYAMSDRTPDKERALRLANAADLLIEALANELYRLR